MSDKKKMKKSNRVDGEYVTYALHGGNIAETEAKTTTPDKEGVEAMRRWNQENKL